MTHHQAERNDGRILVSGEPHPDKEALWSHCDALSELGLAADEDVATFRFDDSRPDGCKLYIEYPQAPAFSMPFAARVEVPAGGEWELRSADELFELMLKGGCQECGGALRARSSSNGADGDRARRSLAEPCKHSFKACPAVRYPAASAAGEPPVCTPLSEFCAGGRAPYVEALAAIVQRHPAFPPYMALCRVAGSSLGEGEADEAALRDAVYKGDGGYTKPGPLQGARFTVWFGCSFPSCPDGSRSCPARLAVFMRVGDDLNLYAVHVGCHEHATGACKCGKMDCLRCFRARCFPMSVPSGSAGGFSGAALLRVTQDAVACLNSGRASSGKALAMESARRANPWTRAYRNTQQFGTGTDNFASLRADDNVRMLKRQGVALPAPAAAGGPTTALGRTLEQLVRAATPAIRYRDPCGT